MTDSIMSPILETLEINCKARLAYFVKGVSWSPSTVRPTQISKTSCLLFENLNVTHVTATT